MVQIRNVPEDIQRKLKSRAALAGLSLSDYLLLELRRGLDRPTRQELLERLSGRTTVTPRRRPAFMVRRERERK
jgi:plasmid stability protein